MITVKITKNIMNAKTNMLGITTKQMILLIIGMVVGAATFFLLKAFVPISLLMWLVFVEIALYTFVFVIKINGVSCFKMLFCKKAVLKPFIRKGVFTNAKNISTKTVKR